MRIRCLTLFAVVLSIGLSGCARLTGLSPTSEVSEASPSLQSTIATDFVSVLIQLREWRPQQTTIDLPESDRGDEFTRAIRDALLEAGYGIRWVSTADTDTYFQYRMSAEKGAASSTRNTYELSVGSVEMRRGYATDGDRRIYPATPLYVRGADASAVVLRDELFSPGTGDIGAAYNSRSRGVDASPAGSVVPVDAQAVELQPGDVNAAQKQGSAHASSLKYSADYSSLDGLNDPSNPSNPSNLNDLNGSDEVYESNSSTDPIDETGVLAFNEQRLVKSKVGMPRRASDNRIAASQSTGLSRRQNVFELGESNFSNLLSSHSLVAERVLTFANDSMRLGAHNKSVVDKLVQQFREETDVFTVTGCSMGPTDVPGGNEALALGRAGRVIEALRYAGVRDQYILDEGCWSGGGRMQDLPFRGVVLSLSRRN